MYNKILYSRFIVSTFVLFCLTVCFIPSLYSQVNWIYNNQEVKDYLIENDPAIDASKLSEEMLENVKSEHTGAMADLQFVILRDSQLDILSVFSPTEPPDYGAAGEIIIDIGLPAINELATWAGYFNPFSSALLNVADTFGKILNYANWLYYNQDLIFVNKQIRYYFYYKKTYGGDPFSDFGIVGDGYLYPPTGLNYGGIYEPSNPDIYTVDRVKELAEAWYVYCQQHDTDYQRYRAEILSGVNSIFRPMIKAYDEYASGQLTKALVVGSNFVVVGNKGDCIMKNAVLVNDLIIGDQRTDPIDINPGEIASIQPSFTDIDYLEFDIFGAPVQLDFDEVTVSMIPLFTYQFTDDPPYAPQTVTFRINPIPVGDPYSYQLDFGDGNSANGSATAVTFVPHTYLAPGRFSVSLTVTAPDDYSDTTWRIVEIQNPVTAAYPLCNDDQGYAPFAVSFDASGSSSATGGSLSYNWDFGNGNQDFGVSPNHTFDPGGFQVQLIAFLTPEISDTTVQTVEIWNPVLAFFTSEIGIVQNDSVEVSFNAQPPDSVQSRSATGQITNYHWNFGDGYSMDTQGATITHKYEIDHYYTAQLTVTDNNNYSDSFQKDINLYSGPTYINGLTISDYTEWDNLHSPYVIQGNITVANSGILFLQKGTIVKIKAKPDRDQLRIIVNGTLICDGEEGNEIIFTSDRDDSYGGDTNNDGDATSPLPKDWGCVHFSNSSVNSVMNYVIMKYGGYRLYYDGGWGFHEYYGLINLNHSSVTVSNCELSQSYQYGIQCMGTESVPQISNNTITENQEPGIYIWDGAQPTIDNNSFIRNKTGIHSKDSSPIISNNQFMDQTYRSIAIENGSPDIFNNHGSNNAVNGISIWGSFTNDIHWKFNPDFPYILPSNITLQGPTTIDPGVVVKFQAKPDRDQLRIIVNGTLICDGEEGNEIIFTSDRDDSYGGDTNNDGDATSPLPKDWGCVHFSNTSENSVMDHVIMKYGGHRYYVSGGYGFNKDYGLINLDHSSLTVSNCVLSQSSRYGIQCMGTESVPQILNNTITDNQEPGIYIWDGAQPTIDNNSFIRNKTGIHSKDSSPIISNNQFMDQTYRSIAIENGSPDIFNNHGSNNAVNGISIWGSFTNDIHWKFNPDFPYILPSNITLQGPTTIDPGVVVKFQAKPDRDQLRIIVNGILVCDGEEGNEIIFTSDRDDTYGGDTNNDGDASSPAPDDWGCVHFSNTSENSLMDHVIMKYGGHRYYVSGGYGFNKDYGLINLDHSSLTVSNCVLSQSSRYGIQCIGTESVPQILNNTITDNQYGIYIRDGAQPVVSGNNILNNSNYGVRNITSSVTTNAENNYWGELSGPFDDSDDRATGGWYNPDGQGDKVSNYVDYEPWLVEQCVPPVDTTQTVPPGDPDPVISPQIQLTLDFQSGPGGDVTIEEFSSFPPSTNKQDVDIQLFKTTASHNPGSFRDSLRFVRRHWVTSSDDIEDGSFTASIGIQYDMNDFPDSLKEADCSILFFHPDSTKYEIVPSTLDTKQDSIWTTYSLDHFGLFALGDFFCTTNTNSFPQQSWYLVSLPVKPQDGSLSEIFPTAVGECVYIWNGSNYQPIYSLEIGQGYWLALSSPWEGDYSGESVYEYTLHFDKAGWYLIGGVREIVSFSNPDDTPDGSVLTPAFMYDYETKQYKVANELYPRTGYWIAVLNECDLTIGINSSGAPGKQVAKTIANAFYETYGNTPPSLPLIDWETGKIIKIPETFALRQNYPNPFNPTTTIEFDLPKESHVEIVIYNILGQKIITLLKSELQAGTHTVLWHGEDNIGQSVSSGIYLVRMVAGKFSDLKKLLLLQ